MRITREADYALRITLVLAESDKWLDAKTISEKMGVPYRFTLKILRKIVAAGYIRSHRGVNGGYELAVPAADISLKDIIEVIDGELAINRCLGDEPCPNSPKCRVREKLAHVQAVMAAELDNVRFAELVR